MTVDGRSASRPAVAGWTVGAAMVGVTAVISTAVGLPSGAHPPFHVPAALLSVAFFGSSLLVVSFDRRGEVHDVNIIEIPLLVGIVFTPASALLIARAAAHTAYALGAKRQPLYKAWFNVAMNVLDTVVAIQLYYLVLGSARPTSPVGWLAAAVALVGCAAADWICLSLVFAVASGRRTAIGVLRDIPLSTAITFSNGCVALIAIVVLWSDWLGALLLACACSALGAGYLAHDRLRRRSAVLSRIHDFTQALDGVMGMDGLLNATLDGARELLGARSSELWLQQATGWLHYTSTDDGVEVRTTGGPDRLEERALSGGRGVLIPKSTKHVDRRVDPTLEGRGVTDAIAVPLQNPDLVGILTIADRLNPHLTFNADDLKALSSMAAHAGVALHSALLLDRLAREAEEKEYQALHDSLTGLPNRTMFANEVESAIAQRAASDAAAAVAVMLLDLDSFKEVNDTLGHGVGDVVLKVIASRLQAELGERGMVARLGGDEYAVILPVDGADHALREAEAVKACVEKPVDEEGLLIEPRTSIGVALSPDNGDDAATLLRLADVAMYSAKERRTGITLYEAKHDHYSPRRLTLAGELRQAITAGELLVAYQPQQDLESGAITAVEALLRWNHRTHGFIPPDEFIPVAEQTGLIVPLTDYVLTEALGQLVRWQRQGLDLEVAVNLSPRVVQDGQLPALVGQRLESAGVDPGRLTLELTETGLITDHARVGSILRQLAGMGVRVSIDDFGTGYSSLSRLSDLPVHEVKIDKSFVFAMAKGAPETVVRSIIDLGHNLGLRVVAEGVEDLGTLQRLRQLRCHAVQGYVLSRAVPPNVLEAWLADQYVAASAERVIVPLRRGRI